MNSEFRVGLMFVVPVLLLGISFFSIEIVDRGTVKAGYRFGTYTETLNPGFHFVNPLTSWHELDTQDQLYDADATIPTQDNQASVVDFNLTFAAIPEMANVIFGEAGGSLEAVRTIHVEKEVRSAMRRVGKSIVRAEDLFRQEVQAQLETNILEEIREVLASKGIDVRTLNIRDINFPPLVEQAIQQKKQAAQAAEKAEEELRKFKIDQERKIAQAEAEKRAAIEMAETIRIQAEAQAEKVRIAAEARAFEIERVNQALSSVSPEYIQIQAISTLGVMSKDPAAKMFFLDPNKVNPLPLMNIDSK